MAEIVRIISSFCNFLTLNIKSETDRQHINLVTLTFQHETVSQNTVVHFSVMVHYVPKLYEDS